MSNTKNPRRKAPLAGAIALATTAILTTPIAAFGKATPPAPAAPEATPEPAKEAVAPKLPKLKFKKETILLKELVFSSKVQARESLNKEALADYTDIAKDAKAKGADWDLPPLKAVKRNGEILVFSGFTRGNALKKAEVEETAVELAECDTITDGQLFELAIQANQENGARLTNADKLHNLLRVIRFPEFADLSNNALVPIVGASEFFIRKHRPVASSSTTRKTSKGGTIKTGNIGKGKKKAAAAAGGTVDEPNLDLPAGSTDASKGATTTDSTGGKLSEDGDRALTRITNLLEGQHGLTAKGVREAILAGTIKVSESDLKLWSQTSDARVIQIAPLVVNQGWSPKKAFALIDKPVDSNTKVSHLINTAITTGGVTRRNTVAAVGEPLEDHPTFSVAVFDNTKWKLVPQAVEAAPAGK